MGDKMSDKTNEPVKELKGLTEQEAALRVEQGLDNRADTTTDKSIKEIIFSNAFTYFNLIFNYFNIAAMRKIIPESDISADCYRKYADWHCTGTACEADFR